MPIDIRVPSFGESVTEGRLSRWLKPNGATVKIDEPVCELETDKATAEVPAPAAGILKQGAKEGDTVAVGVIIGSIEPAGTAQTTPAAPRPPKDEKKVPVLMPAARRAAEEAGV